MSTIREWLGIAEPKGEVTTWKFTPQSDITTYELAVILKCTLGELKNEILVRDGKMIPPEYRRHFTPR